MKFYYLICKSIDKENVLMLNCPYIIEDYARSLMQTYISENKRIMNLPNGEYLVALYGESNNHNIDLGQTKGFIITNNQILWKETI